MVRKIQLDTVSLYRGGPVFTAIAVAEKIQFFTVIAVGHRCNFYSKIYMIIEFSQQNIYNYISIEKDALII